MTTITSLSQLDLDKHYNYNDYLTWDIKEKIELIKGKVLITKDTPARPHQDISQNINRILYRYFKNHPCRVYFAPFDVRLYSPSREIETVVQPDLCVVCDLDKLDTKGCLGAPDLVVEILPPSNTKKEMSVKFDIYQEAGVREYWIVNPNEGTLLIYTLKDGIYIGMRPYVAGETQTAHSAIFPEMVFDVDDLFRQ
ncbi:MAG: Uma2 family endonuclease [Moraxella sp.]|nr:Uma2 family endonuclease [Moraxella sp.]